MIKHIGLVPRHLTDAVGVATIRERVASWATAPESSRPRWGAVGVVMDLDRPAPCPYGAVTLARLDGRDHLERFEGWMGLDGERGGGRVGELDVVVATEMTVRGDDSFEVWRSMPGTRFVHMAVAERAEGLSRTTFSERWVSHAGAVRPAGVADAIVIPAELRGEGYIQNHPVMFRSQAWDAVNEVWFDDRDLLAARTSWFDDVDAVGFDRTLFGEHRFLPLEVSVIF